MSSSVIDFHKIMAYKSRTCPFFTMSDAKEAPRPYILRDPLARAVVAGQPKSVDVSSEPQRVSSDINNALTALFSPQEEIRNVGSVSLDQTLPEPSPIVEPAVLKDDPVDSYLENNRRRSSFGPADVRRVVPDFTQEEIKEALRAAQEKDPANVREDGILRVSKKGLREVVRQLTRRQTEDDEDASESPRVSQAALDEYTKFGNNIIVYDGLGGGEEKPPVPPGVSVQHEPFFTIPQHVQKRLEELGPHSIRDWKNIIARMEGTIIRSEGHSMYHQTLVVFAAFELSQQRTLDEFDPNAKRTYAGLRTALDVCDALIEEEPDKNLLSILQKIQTTILSKIKKDTAT